MKKLISVFALIFLHGLLIGQQMDINVNFPPFSGEMFSGQVSQITIVNSGSAIPACRVQWQLFKQNELLYEVMTDPFTLPIGISTPLQVSSGKSKFAAANATTYWNKTGMLPAGSYTLLLTLHYVRLGEDLSENFNTSFSVAPQIPIELSYPGNRENIATLTPQLLWIPPQPINAATVNYTLVVYNPSLKGGKMTSRLKPYFIANHLSGNSLPYTGIDKPLEYNKTYPWQVIAYDQGEELCKSEVWFFTPEPETTHTHQEIVSHPDSARVYWVLDQKLDAGFYVANRNLYFSFSNYTSDTLISYHITENTNPQNMLGNMPAVHIKKGLNYCCIPLASTGYFTDGRFYFITLQTSDHRKYQFQFRYTDGSNN